MVKIVRQWDPCYQVSEPGREEYEIYDLVGRYPAVVGVRNRYQEIQEAAVGSTLSELIERYGEGNIPFNDELPYLDTSVYPENMPELMNMFVGAGKNDVEKVAAFLRGLQTQATESFDKKNKDGAEDAPKGEKKDGKISPNEKPTSSTTASNK